MKHKINIYTPSLFALENLIYLKDIGISDSYIHNKNTDFYLFHIVLDGKGQFLYDHKEMTLSKGDCIFIDCHKEYELISSKDNSWKTSWVCFNGNNMINIYKKFLSQYDSFYFTAKARNQYESLISQIYVLSQKKDINTEMKIYELLVRLLTYIMDEDKKGHISLSNKIKIKPVKEYIDQHYTEYMTLDDLSKKFYINKYYLSKLYKEEYGISIIAYLNHLRINKSKELLKASNEKIESISKICGIEDQSYFIRLFKKIEGITPGEFRKIWSKTE